jgi:dipeptidyl aminopeptidase/acylaminoacyl peptidase
VGRSFAPGISVSDRHGNTRSASLTSTSNDCMTAVNQVTGVSVGRCSIIVAAEPLVDSLHVSVVPMLSVLAIRNEYDPLKTPRLVSMGLDGTGYTELAPLTYQFPADLLMPLRAPDRRRITMHAGSGPYSTRLTIFDSSMTARTFVMQGINSAQENWGRFSPDGQWLYFSSRASAGEPYAVWRARPDGSQAERITPVEAGFGFSNYSDITPDGKTVVYVGGQLELRAIDVATRTVRSLTAPLQAYQLRIAPDGQRVAFVFPHPGRFGIHVINIDGSGYRLLSQQFGYDVGDVPFDWTPDGKWILTRRHEFEGDASGGVVHFREWALLNAESGAWVPLPYKSFTPTSMMVDR